MYREQSNSQKHHYHIYWTKKGHFDWEGFDAHAEALARALELAQPSEMFAIEEVSACRLCGLSFTQQWRTSIT
jgi:hypothetical protein